LVAVGKMAAMITHEVRNPLSSIGLNTELLVDELAGVGAEAGAEARALCASITTEIDRLTAITEEYLRFARLPKPKLAPEAVDRMVASLVDFEREQLAKRKVRVEVEIPGDLPLVLADDGQIRQSLLNLLRNAAEAVEEVGGGRVVISGRLSERDGFVEVVVRDEGRGIEPEVAGKLFDPFFSTKAGGTGLGLALTEQIIREHGGDIRVEGGLGSGAAFVVSLPTSKVTSLADGEG
jgi:signal transduction histidine kinase